MSEREPFYFASLSFLPAPCAPAASSSRTAGRRDGETVKSKRMHRQGKNCSDIAFGAVVIACSRCWIINTFAMASCCVLFQRIKIASCSVPIYFMAFSRAAPRFLLSAQRSSCSSPHTLSLRAVPARVGIFSPLERLKRFKKRRAIAFCCALQNIYCN